MFSETEQGDNRRNTHGGDENGVSRPIVMGTYGIGVGRLMAAAIEQSHDEKGIIWPLPIAPYHVHICGLFMDTSCFALC